MRDLPETLQKQPPSSRLPGGRNELIRLDYLGQRLAVKRFVNKGLWKKIAYRIESSKAKRSYSHSLALIDAGLHSPQPIAWSELWSGGWLQESHYLCAYLDYEHDASALLESDCADREEKLALLGLEIARMHDAGLLHLDVNQGNWLFFRSAEGAWKVSIIDNNRLKKTVVSKRRGVKCLLQLDFDEQLRDRLLLAYARGRGFDFDGCKSILDRSCRRFELKWKIKNTTRPWRRKLGL